MKKWHCLSAPAPEPRRQYAQLQHVHPVHLTHQETSGYLWSHSFMPRSQPEESLAWPLGNLLSSQSIAYLPFVLFLLLLLLLYLSKREATWTLGRELCVHSCSFSTLVTFAIYSSACTTWQDVPVCMPPALLVAFRTTVFALWLVTCCQKSSVGQAHVYITFWQLALDVTVKMRGTVMCGNYCNKSRALHSTRVNDDIALLDRTSVKFMRL